MSLNRYDLRAGEELEVFEFTSVGPKGKIPKIVQYSKTNYKGVYNLGFGDKNLDTGELDDLAISNNNDSEKILTTVVSTLYAFFDKHPGAFVYITGSTKSRTRLYQMGINKYFDESNSDFVIFGEKNKEWEVYKNGEIYDSFLIKMK